MIGILQEAESLLARRKLSRAERRQERAHRVAALDADPSHRAGPAERNEMPSRSGDGGTAEVEEALYRQMEMQKMLQVQLEVPPKIDP